MLTLWPLINCLGIRNFFDLHPCSSIHKCSSIFDWFSKIFHWFVIWESQIWTRIYRVWNSPIWNLQFLENGGRSESDIFNTKTLLANALSEPHVSRGSFGGIWSLSETQIWITHPGEKFICFSKENQRFARQSLQNEGFLKGRSKIWTIILRKSLFF